MDKIFLSIPLFVKPTDTELSEKIMRLYSNMSFNELGRYFALEEVRKEYKVIDGKLVKQDDSKRKGKI